MMDSTSTVILTASCHVGTPVKPSRSITKTGALKGKILKTIQIGLFGKNISRDRNQNGAMAKSVYIDPKLCASRTVELMAATAADRTANNE